MPKISGLGLGEVKKISGVGIGSVMKVSGLGLGLLWQSITQLGMGKSGSFSVQSSYTTVTGWTPDDGTTISNNGILVTTAGTYTIATNLQVTGTSFLSRQITLRLIRNFAGGGSSTLATGPTPSYNSSSGAQPYPLSHTATAYAVGDYITLEADSNVADQTEVLTGGTIHLIPVV